MSREQHKPSPIGNFFSKIGRRVRSKSPAPVKVASVPTATGKENENDGVTFKCPKTPDTPGKFGTLVSRLSGRKTKKDNRSATLASRADSMERGTNSTFSSPRGGPMSISENDLRYVTVARGGRRPVDVTPLAGASSFMSEDNLNSSAILADEQGPTSRAPSYVNLTKSLCGYRSPQPIQNSPVSAMPMGLVERRLHQFRETTNVSDSTRTPPRGVAAPLYPETPKVSSMGANYSTPSPVKALLGQFERLNICNSEKDEAKCDEIRAKTVDPVISQPIQQVHTMEEHIGTIISVSTSDNSEKTVTDEADPTVNEKKDEVRHEEISPAGRSDDSAVSRLVVGDDAEEVTSVDTGVYSEPTSLSARSGEGFQQLLEDTRNALKQRTQMAERDLEQVPDLSEAASSSLRMAIGKASLLVRKKLPKFNELVQKNLKPVEGDPQPATLDDLEGYWALVEIELSDINAQFAEVEEWRSADWKLDSKPVQVDNVSSNNNNEKVTPAPKPRAARPPVAAPKPKSEKQKAAEELRRKQMAEARARMAEARKAERLAEKGGSDGVTSPIVV